MDDLKQMIDMLRLIEDEPKTRDVAQLARILRKLLEREQEREDSMDFLNVRQAAQILGVHPNTVSNWSKGPMPRLIPDRVIGPRQFPRYKATKIYALREQMNSGGPVGASVVATRVPRA